MKSMTRSEKWTLAITLFWAVFGCIIGYFAWQARNELADIRMQASDATQQVKMMEARLSKTLTSPDLKKMNQAIPPDWQLPRFFADVTLLANEHKVQIHSLTPGELIRPEPTEESQNASDGEESLPASEREAGQTAGSDKEQDSNVDLGDDEVAENNNEANPEESLGPLPPKSLTGVYTLPVMLEVKGNITEVLAFIDELQQLPRLVWVTGFELLMEEPDQKDYQINQKPIDLQINLNLYSHAPWAAVEYVEEWPFEIRPAENEEAFDTP